MASPSELSRDSEMSAYTRRQRLFGGWWRRQSPTRQDRFATIGPLVSVLLFLAAIIAAFWYLRNEEIARETDSVQRDTEIAQQQIRLRLQDDREQLDRLARRLSGSELDAAQFSALAAVFAHDRPALTHLSWVLPNRALRGSHAVAAFHPEVDPSGDAMQAALPVAGESSEPERSFQSARASRQAVYSRAFRNASGTNVFQLHLPLLDRASFTGALIAEYSIDTLLRGSVPPEVTQRHTVAVLDADGRELAGSVLQMPGQRVSRPTIVHDLPLAPTQNGLVLRGQGWRTSVGLVGNTLFWMVVALSVLTVWMLLGTWRHMRRRGQMQSALVQETNFRRAMENSMLTGMRAMDADGRITYVNPAFCAMTGFTEAELVGQLPPFPHWPPDRIDENLRLLAQELQGRSPSGGIEVKVMRKEGTLFDARMYVSPLIDARGLQTGWMTSMTNITEAKRIRDQLSASHERFTTVLEGLDAAVSVLSVQQSELLFANRSYRLWFGAESSGHALLVSGSVPAKYTPDAEDLSEGFSGLPTQAVSESASAPREVFVAPLQKWFDVRSRYLQWTDGRLAQMVIATDITARLRAEQQAAQQAERAQVTSRLVTMGEMASSVAHELNQIGRASCRERVWR